MAEELTIIAHIDAKEEKVEFVKEETLKLIEPTLKEDGCVEYRLKQDNENPNIFIFVETWKTKEHWLAHMETDHIKVMSEKLDGCLNELKVYQMTEIN